MIKVLGVNASPRKYGNTAKLLYVSLFAAEKYGAQTEIIHLYDYKIEPCQACLADEQLACRPPCIKRDEVWEVLKKFRDSDAVIISTPVYWYGVPGHLKNLIDKLTVFENMIFIDGRSWLEGKLAAFIALAAEAGAIETISYLMSVFNSYGYHIPPWALAYYHGTDDVLSHKEPVMDALNIGKIIVQAAKMLKVMEKWYDPSLYDEVGKESIEYALKKAKENEIDAEKRRQMFINKMLSENPNNYR